MCTAVRFRGSVMTYFKIFGSCMAIRSVTPVAGRTNLLNR